MNRPENVPIATLSGVASLTNLACELPLPSSSSATRDPVVFGSIQHATEASRLIFEPSTDMVQLNSLTALLGSVNNAYLDFKNSTYNRPMIIESNIPPVLQEILQYKPDVLQPHFDAYHGSPLKTNAVASMAYSPNQRNVYLLHQQQNQQVHNLSQPSPLLQGTQFSSGSSSPMKSPHVQQFFKTNHIQSPRGVYNNMASPHSSMKMPQLQKQVQTNATSVRLSQNEPPQMQQLSHSPLQRHSDLPRNIPSTDCMKPSQIAPEHPQQQGQFFSPLKTRGQRQGPVEDHPRIPERSTLSKPQDVRKNLNNIEPFQNCVESKPVMNLQEPPKHVKTNHKKKHGIKEIEKHGMSQIDTNLNTNLLQSEIITEDISERLKENGKPNEPVDKQNLNYYQNEQTINHIRANSKSGEMPQLELRVPKLIVRKVRRIEGNNEIETLEVYSPDKPKQICEVTSPSAVDEYNRSESVRSKRTRSSASSVSSAESIQITKKRKTIHIRELSSDDDEDNANDGTKTFNYNGANDIDDGVEVKMVVKKFVFIMDKILDHELELETDGNLDFHEDQDIPPETLLPRPAITSLCCELAKMKSSRMLKEIPTDQLVRVISVMDRHVRDTMQFIIANDEDGEEGKRWYSIQAERIVRSAEAAVAILHITTTPDMPKQVFLEEAIENIAVLCQFHLENTIYPEFDPIYKVHSSLNDSAYLNKSKRSKGMGTKNKFALQMYNKFCEVVSLLGDLIGKENLTDSIILKMSQIGISPFFVEHVNVLQLEALKVARTVFRNYVKHRDLILDDILASLARLPSSKRNLRNYRLQENVSIQMFTALVLQLVQCTVQIPQEVDSDQQRDQLVDKDVLIVKGYEDSLRAARNFMSIFLKKCSSNSRDENDFRPLFENFLHDLFTAANLPEWPAAEVLLTQLGRMFVVTFSNSKLDMSLRSSALDYLSQITTHLRKYALKNEATGEQEKLKLIITKLINTKDNEEEVPVVDDMEVYDEKLRKSLLLFLQSSGDGDPSFKYARDFYLGQWLRDVQMDIEKSMIAPMLSIPGAATKLENEDDQESDSKAEVSAEKLQILQEKKDFYHTLIKDQSTSTLRSVQPLNYESACVVVDYLASTRSFSQSFDIYITQIFKMLSEQAIGLRTKAVKALTVIVSVDPLILSREDVQTSVHGRLLDPSTNVREAAVDLIGQFILKCPELIKQYYDMIIARILDTGISVRKRVIKILKDICMEHPDFDKIPEICSKMIRRVDDEVGIKKLVTDVFRSMWFQPVVDFNRDSNILYQKAVNITKVVSLCNKDTGFDWLESLLKNLLDPDNEHSKTNTVKACQQLVDCLFHRILKPDNNKSDGSNTVVPCLITLYLFCKSYPTLLIPHANTLQPYFTSKINSYTDTLIIQQVSKILELVVPLMEHPNPKFLAELEEDAMKLILKQSQNVVQSCASCLAAIINKVTHNYKFVVDGFNQFFKFLKYYKREHQKAPDASSLKPKKPTLLRSLFTIGLFCRYFDLDSHIKDNTSTQEDSKTTSEQVFDLCMYFTDFKDEDITIKAVLAISFIGIHYPKLLLRDDCRKLYQEVLSPNSLSVNVKFTVMRSLHNHLMEEENRLHEAEKMTGGKKKIRKNTNQSPDKKNIKEFGDNLSGTTSEIIQVYLTDIMKSFFHVEKQVRISALQVVTIVLRQGLVHPAQCVPYLIAISTDNERLCHVKAEQCLNDLDSRYQGFIHMKALQGVRMAYEMQIIIQKNNGGYLCGYRETENKNSLINHVYGLVRSNKQYRRPFLLSILKLFNKKKSNMDLLFFLVENLAYLSYNTHEEPLFIIHHIDTSVSVTGANIVQSFKELFHPCAVKNRGGSKSGSDDEEDVDQTPEGHVDEAVLNNLVRQSIGSVLLLELKQYLKTVYGFTDSKCQKYSPLEPSKLYDKTLTRKCDLDFETEFKETFFSTKMTHDELVNHYIKFKEMMMSLDTDDGSDTESPDKLTPTDEKILVENNSLSTDSNQQLTNTTSNTDGNQPEIKLQAGVISQRMDSMMSLPGLSININVPVIPSHVYQEVKPKRRKSGSRRSSRSSRGSIANDT